MQAIILLPDWQCSTCTANQKLARGCETDAKQPVELDGEKLKRCPRRMLLDQPIYAGEIWWLYSRYSDGMLPEHGGLYDQPAKYLAVVRLLETVRAAADSENEQKEKRRKAIQANAGRVLGAG